MFSLLRNVMHILKISFLIFTCFSNRISCQEPNLYTVVAPSKLRPDVVYHVSISLHNAPAAADFTIKIFGINENGIPVSVLKNKHVEPNQSEIVDFELFDFKPGNYSLEVTSLGGVIMKNVTKLKYEHKSYSVFIQTDRAVYKSSQLVQFRVIAVNPYLLPISNQIPIDLTVKDGKINSVEEWIGVYPTSGVASAEFKLADHPVLGDWSIHVNIEGQKFSKNFTVADIIVPTYEIKIHLPAYATYNKSDIDVTIKAMHSYGKPVKGEVTLTVAPRTRYNKLSVRPYESFQTKAQVDGAVTIYLNLLQDLTLRTDFFKREIEFFALVEESETGHKYNSTNTMWIYDKDIKIDFIKTSKTFKPGLKFTGFLKLSYQDGTPVSESGMPLELKHGFTVNEEDWKSELYTVPRNGIVRLDFLPPNEEDTSRLNMRAIFKGQTFYLNSIDGAVSPSNNFIQVSLITPNPKVQGTIEMEINSTEPINHLVYKVFARGNIILAKTIPVPNLKVYRFNFKAASAMAPRARVLVYYIRRANNEIVADSLAFDVEGIFKTFITVSPNTRESQPGQEVNIKLQTSPNAFVGVLGVDKEISKIKLGNDITQEKIIEELEQYDDGYFSEVSPPWYRRRKRSVSWPGSKSAALVFQDSGSIIMTNAFLLNTGNEDIYTENVIRIDENINNAPFQPPAEIPETETSEEPLILRKKYPETWLWINTTAGNDGITSISHVVPDALTSFVLTAFAIDPINGLGIASAPSQITVYRTFFITMSLPYSLLWGEDLAIQVVIFNFNHEDIKVEVTMENKKGEFDFILAGQDSRNLEYQYEQSKFVTVPSSDGLSVSFIIVPKKLGLIEIQVLASSSLNRDTVTKKLQVLPEGSTQFYNQAFFINLQGASFKKNVSTLIPRNAIRGSGKIYVSATVDLMATSIKGMNKLLYIPTGCGEQNLITIMPLVIFMDYLIQTNQLTSSMKNHLISGLKYGYQRQLTYKRKDGSFSTFGERDRSGSTWLTAYAIRTLSSANKYIFVDTDILKIGLDWVASRQAPDGSFEEFGEVHHKVLQGQAGNGAALTAYVLMTFYEAKAQSKYERQMILAQRYIENEIVSNSIPYIVSITSYVLHLLNSPLKDRSFQMLLNMALKDGEVLYWDNNENKVNMTDKQSDYWFLATSLDIETAAYAIRTFALRSDSASALPILRWLIMKQNKNGGFSSTQDTVVALHALREITPLISPRFSDLSVVFSYSNSQKSLQISNINALNIQELEIPPETTFIELEVSGSGIGVIMVSHSFNLAVSGETPQFFLNALLDKTSTASYLQLSICTHQRERINDTSNMALMEVSLPSGYVADVDALPSILQIPKVKRVETQLQDTNVIIYFDRLDGEESCVTVPAHRIHKVARQRRQYVKVYDFYNRAKSARMFYRPHKTVLCDICDSEDCGENCFKESGEESPISSSQTILKLSYCLITVMCIIHLKYHVGTLF